jgi:hypothetical protein
MGLSPEVRVVDFLTGDPIKNLPSFLSLPRQDDFIELSEDGGPSTSYEVKRITHVLDVHAIVGSTGGTSYHVNGYVRLEVQE